MKNYLNRILAGAMVLYVTPPCLYAQTQKKSELKINEEAIKLIQFDFTGGMSEEDFNRPLDSPMEKKWMEFKADFAVPKNLVDTTKVRKPKGYIRLLPYSIWTKFGEDPVFDVMVFGNQKKYTINWTLNPFRTYSDENYGLSIAPSAGFISDGMRIRGAGLTINNLDFIGFIYDNFTKHGRMLKHNEKHANAWKIYNKYQPTLADSLKFPTFYSGLEGPVFDYSVKSDTMRALSGDGAFVPFEELPDSVRNEIQMVISQKRDSLRIEYLREADEEADKKRKSKRVKKSFKWNVKKAKAAREAKEKELEKIEKEKKMLEELPGSLDDIYMYMRNKEAGDSIRREEKEKERKMEFNYEE